MFSCYFVFRGADSDDWAIDVATKTIQKLLEVEKKSLHPKEPVITIKEEEPLHGHEIQINQSAYECNFSEEDDINSSKNNIDAEEEHVSDVAIDAEAFSPGGEGSLVERDYADTNTLNLRQLSFSNMQLENADFEKAAADEGNDEKTESKSDSEE